MSIGTWYVGIRAEKWHDRTQAHYMLRGALMNGKLFAAAFAKHYQKRIPVRSSKGGHGDDENEPFKHGDNLPLFYGELETRLFDKLGDETPYQLCGLGYNGYIRLTFPVFNLNPLRYARHQPLPVGDDWGKSKWFKNPVPTNTAGEFSFTNDDNWLPSTPEWDDFTSSANWQRHLRRYVSRVTKLVRSEFQQAISKAENQDFSSPFEFGDLVEVPDYKIRELETAWEFEDSDPCERIRSLKQQLIDLGRGELTASVYRGQLNLMRHKGAETKEFNSVGLRVKLRSDMELRVYAKTNKRVRFEIIQNEPSRAKLLKAAKIASADDEKAYSEIPVLLKQARHAAAAMLNKTVLPSIASKPDFRVRQRSVVGFLSDCAKACEDARSVRDVLSLLVSNDGLQVGVPGKPIPKALSSLINKLKSKPKLIVWSSERSAYRVAPRYRWALEQLRNLDENIITNLLGTAPPRER